MVSACHGESLTLTRDTQKASFETSGETPGSNVSVHGKIATPKLPPLSQRQEECPGIQVWLLSHLPSQMSPVVSKQQQWLVMSRQMAFWFQANTICPESDDVGC